MKIKEFLKLDKTKLAFLLLGSFLAISIEQQMWWNLILFTEGKLHNDFFFLISEDINSFKEAGKLNVLYQTNLPQAILVWDIWNALVAIGLIIIAVSVAIALYSRFSKK